MSDDEPPRMAIEGLPGAHAFIDALWDVGPICTVVVGTGAATNAAEPPRVMVSIQEAGVTAALTPLEAETLASTLADARYRFPDEPVCRVLPPIIEGIRMSARMILGGAGGPPAPARH